MHLSILWSDYTVMCSFVISYFNRCNFTGIINITDSSAIFQTNYKRAFRCKYKKKKLLINKNFGANWWRCKNKTRNAIVWRMCCPGKTSIPATIRITEPRARGFNENGRIRYRARSLETAVQLNNNRIRTTRVHTFVRWRGNGDI